jgi:uncharacterized protein YjiS (DUF1127 family)
MLTPAITPDRPWPYKPAHQATGSMAWASLAAGTSHLVAPVLRWYRARRDSRQLMAFGDHMLHDIGLSRGEIERAVRTGRDRI